MGPHTFYALPGRMLITGLSNVQDKGGLCYESCSEYTNDGEHIRTVWIPKKVGNTVGDGYGYDVRVNANLNTMLTSFIHRLEALYERYKRFNSFQAVHTCTRS
ncbi:MAG: hypothetical protein Q9N34_05925 [Aquificota bacterium]|nr:hypothetical protein [Aquificota bacterium]